MSENSMEKQYNGGWSESTNPREHNPDNYRYLVHAFNLTAKNRLAIANISSYINNPELAKSATEVVDIYKNPNQIQERLSISCSLINQDKNVTWGDSGLILENNNRPYITSNQDAVVINHNSQLLEQQSKNNYIQTPEAILFQTNSETYNEIVIQGNGTRIVGVFAKVNEDGEYLTPNPLLITSLIQRF